MAEHLVPESSLVLLFLAYTGRDPRYWAQPDRFDPARKNAGHVGFGYGIHQCLGRNGRATGSRSRHKCAISDGRIDTPCRPSNATTQ